MGLRSFQLGLEAGTARAVDTGHVSTGPAKDSAAIEIRTLEAYRASPLALTIGCRVAVMNNELALNARIARLTGCARTAAALGIDVQGE